MSALRTRMAQHHRAAKARRAFDRALANAPTEASRQELLGLAHR